MLSVSIVAVAVRRRWLAVVATTIGVLVLLIGGLARSIAVGICLSWSICLLLAAILPTVGAPSLSRSWLVGALSALGGLWLLLLLLLLIGSCSCLGWLLVSLLICLLLLLAIVLLLLLLLSVGVAAGVWIVSVPAVLVSGAILSIRIVLTVVLLLVWVNGRGSWSGGGL